MEKVETEIRSYRDLIVWQKSHKLVKLILNIVEKFPQSIDADIIKKQLIRSAMSIPSNIAEGYGGSKGKSFRNFLVIARRSATESDYWVFLSHDLNYIDNNNYNESSQLISEVNALLSAIINKLNES